jgi:hypothetical protein
MSTHQTKQAIRVANVPKEEFERQVESDNAPTVTNPTKYVVLVCAYEICMRNIERETYDVTNLPKSGRLSSDEILRQSQSRENPVVERIAT